MIAFVSFTINAQTKPAETKKADDPKAKAPVAQTKAPAAPVKAAIDVTKLPKEILDNIATHKGFKAIKAESVTDKGITTYVVTVEGNNTKVNYIYDKDKKFVKEEAIKEVTKPAVKKEEPKKVELKKDEPKKETKPADAKPVK